MIAISCISSLPLFLKWDEGLDKNFPSKACFVHKSAMVLSVRTRLNEFRSNDREKSLYKDVKLQITKALKATSTKVLKSLRFKFSIWSIFWLRAMLKGPNKGFVVFVVVGTFWKMFPQTKNVPKWNKKGSQTKCAPNQTKNIRTKNWTENCEKRTTNVAEFKMFLLLFKVIAMGHGPCGWLYSTWPCATYCGRVWPYYGLMYNKVNIS